MAEGAAFDNNEKALNNFQYEIGFGKQKASHYRLHRLTCCTRISWPCNQQFWPISNIVVTTTISKPHLFNEHCARHQTKSCPHIVLFNPTAAVGGGKHC